MSRWNGCSHLSIEPPGERFPVVELLPHGPVAPLRTAVVALRGGRVRAVEEVDVLVRGHRGELLRGRPRVPRVHAAPPEHRLHPAHGRHAAVVPEHLAQSRVQALRRVVRARQRPRLGQRGVQVGERRALRDEPRQGRSGLAEPLVREHPPAVDDRGVLEEVRPEGAPLQVALDPQLRLVEGPDVQQVPGEPVELDPGLEPRARGRVPPDLAERVEDAPLDPRPRPTAPHGAREAGAAVGDDDVRGGDRVHQRRPRPRRLRARHVPGDDALVAAADEDDEVAREPDPVDVEHAVPFAVRDGHRPHLPEPGGPAPEGPPLPGLVALRALGHEPVEELSQRGGVAVPADRGGRPRRRVIATAACPPTSSRSSSSSPRRTGISRTSRRTSRRRFLRRRKQGIYLRMHPSSGHTFCPSAQNRPRVIKSRERAVYLRRRLRIGHTFCPITRKGSSKQSLF